MFYRFACALQISASALLVLLMFACGAATKTNANTTGIENSGNDTPPPQVAIAISPTSVTVGSGATQQFQATVTGSTNIAVTWQVNGVPGGNPESGTISSSGLYIAPSPNQPTQVTVTAVPDADTSKT